MKCFYHNDSDGRCAGYWVRKLARGMRMAEYIEISYSDEFPLDSIEENELVYIVDYSITSEMMDKLLDKTSRVVWIDHHKTAIEKYADYGKAIRGIRYDGIAGCMLTYAYLIHMTDGGYGDIKPFTLDMCDDAPKFTKLIADHDVWKFEFGDTTRKFITAILAVEDSSPEGSLWDDLNSDEGAYLTDCYVNRGGAVMAFRASRDREAIKRVGFETTFEGRSCFAANLVGANSDTFKSLEKTYDILMPFSFNGDKWTVSLYSASVDVGEIAKKHGGGGHKGAAGFVCSELPFKKSCGTS